MNPRGRNLQLCRQALEDGPGTAREIALETGLSIHAAGDALRHLHRRRELHRQPFRAPDSQACWLFALPHTASTAPTDHAGACA